MKNNFNQHVTPSKVTFHMGKEDKNILRSTKPERISQLQTRSSRSSEKSTIPRKRKRDSNKRTKTTKNVASVMVESGLQIWKITLHVNGLKSPVKRNRLAERIKNQKSSICCLQETQLMGKDTHRLKVKGWNKDIPG